MTRHEYVERVIEPRIQHENELYHHGILGMKWGVRRYQNEDGSLTPEGRRRYSSTLVPGGWRPRMPGETIDIVDDDGTYIAYKKRSKKEIEEYDNKQASDAINKMHEINEEIGRIQSSNAYQKELKSIILKMYDEAGDKDLSDNEYGRLFDKYDTEHIDKKYGVEKLYDEYNELDNRLNYGDLSEAYKRINFMPIPDTVQIVKK